MKKISLDDLLLVLMALVFAPHVVRVPVWITLFCCLSWTGAFFVRRSRTGFLPRWVVVVLALGCTAGAAMSFAGAMGRDAGVGLLSLMAGLKPLETRTTRDRMITVFLAYFLTLTNLLYSQSLVLAGFMVTCVAMAGMLQVRMNDSGGGIGEHFQKICVLLAQALPLTLVLFVLFPRISGSLWGFDDPGGKGVTGLSETMAPGRISSLAQSGEIAFRVSFEGGSIPARESLYWRALVLSRFDGRQWSPGEGRLLQEGVHSSGQSVRYTVTAEPSDELWMFALDLPVDSPPGVRFGADFTLSAPVKRAKRVRYTLSSCPGCRNPVPGDLQELVRLPDAGGERARELARSWTRAGYEDPKIVQLALSHFRTEPFYYTLTPPLLAMDDPVDDFLFDVRRGYCEHYASAFTFLMRAAGVPARVVVGYQGGEQNPVGDYLIVRQSDAHAWAEVWLDDSGWVRVDPTAAVSPLRIERGAAAVAAREAGRMLDAPALGVLRGAWTRVRLNWDAVNNMWNQWVLDYGGARQKRVLDFFGIARTWKGVSTGILISLFAVLGCAVVLLLFLGRPVGSGRDHVARIYERFLKKTIQWPNEAGVPPATHMTDLMHSIPERAQEIESIRDLYVSLRYKPVGDDFKRNVQRFKRAVNGFRVPKKG
jgi:transglutaminase-like putative cysteine protease